MIPELGEFALIVALLLAALQASLPLIGAHTGRRPWMAVARPTAQAQFWFVLVAWLCLVRSFLNDDFSVINVAMNSNSLLPSHYKVAAAWGSHEGSLLLWVLMLAGWGLAVSLFSRRLPPEVVARVLGVLGLIAIGFLLFMLLTSDPFDRRFPPATEGRDLNPLLQDPGMVFHPPLLYMGYVGLSVAFAFAIAALLGGRLDAAWARWSRPWTTLAWCFLTLGIALGSWWAYYELGWGGWWFWDPVENASFMPWLVATALMHSLAVTEKRGLFKAWTALLAIFAFSLSLLGTFLVRSGVLTSVHSFATDPTRGVFILIFLSVVIGASLALYALRAPTFGAEGGFGAVSRESFLLANNLLLVAACGTVLLGTMYPLLVDVLDGGKISVGPPYFDAVFVPIMAPLVFLIGIGPLARWKSATLPDLWARLKWALAVALVLGLGLPFVGGRWSPMLAFAYALAAWVVLSMAVQVRQQLRHPGGSAWARLAAQPRAWWGMNAAHLGVAVFVVGVASVSGFQIERDGVLTVGQSVSLGERSIRLDGVHIRQGPNFTATVGDVAVLEAGQPTRLLHPEKRRYFSQAQMEMTEAAIDSGPFGDLYVALGATLGEAGAWPLRVVSKPFIVWIWGGCLLMALGGLLALSDRRYRASRTREVEAAAGPQHAST